VCMCACVCKRMRACMCACVCVCVCRVMVGRRGWCALNASHINASHINASINAKRSRVQKIDSSKTHSSSVGMYVLGTLSDHTATCCNIPQDAATARYYVSFVHVCVWHVGRANGVFAGLLRKFVCWPLLRVHVVVSFESACRSLLSVQGYIGNASGYWICLVCSVFLWVTFVGLFCRSL